MTAAVALAGLGIVGGGIPTAAAHARLSLVKLETEHAPAPLAVDVKRPLLAWTLRSGRRGDRQSAFQVRVASSPRRLARGLADLWDSGRRRSGAASIGYGGRPLRSRSRAWWQVRVWDRRGRVTSWSRAARWEMALLRPTDWRAQWIGGPPGTEANPILRRGFRLRKAVRSARLYVSGLGYAEAYVNGRRVGDEVLDPGFTRYDRRVLYRVHAAGHLLRRGRNAIGVALGRGFFGLAQRNVWGWHAAPWTGEPRLLLRLEVTHRDGTRTVVKSGRDWRTTAGPTQDEAVYGGETFDARRAYPGWSSPGFRDAAWQGAAASPAPAGRLAPQQHEPIRVVSTLRPRSLRQVGRGVFVADFGRVLAGWARLHVPAAARLPVTLRYGERLGQDGRVAAFNTLVEGPFQTDRYLPSGRRGRTWEPRFTYKGFRYVEIVGLPGSPRPRDVAARVVHSALRSTGRFESSGALLERLHSMARRTLTSNFHGLPTDTPAYEKNGWTGDAQLAAEAALLNFDVRRLYRKWLADLRDSQRPDGLVPAFVPDPGGGSPPFDESPPWGAALVLVPWRAYMFSGDRRLLEEHYASMRRYVERELGRAPGGIHSSSLGDWMPPGYFGNGPEDPALAGTAYAHESVRSLARIERELGRPQDAARHHAAAQRIVAAFNAEYLDRAAGVYRTGSESAYRQSPNVLALAFGLVPRELESAVMARLVDDLRRVGLNTGALGTKHLLRVLTRAGQVDLAHELVSARRYPGWGNWLARGATTFWEQWDGSRSLNHALLGIGVEEWLFEDLVGVRPLAPGFRRVEVRPFLPSRLGRAGASLDTVRGRVAAGWRRMAGRVVELRVAVPPGAEAVVHVPVSDPRRVTARGTRRVGVRDGRAVFTTGSGSYAFRVAL